MLTPQQFLVACWANGSVYLITWALVTPKDQNKIESTEHIDTKNNDANKGLFVLFGSVKITKLVP